MPTTSEVPHPKEDAERAPRRSAVRSLLRLLPYLRPVRARLVTAAVIAVVASCIGLVIPLALKWIVDGPVAGRDPSGVWLGGGMLLLLGFAEAGLFGLRRWLVARPLARIEADMRSDLYRHLQRLPVSFHDRWPSGQLLSRATTDLMLLRMFFAFPMTFLLVNGVTVVVGCVILFVQQWGLGLVLLAPILPIVVLCSVFEHRYAVAARASQDQIGDLTTVVEESVLGIRIIKGFGQHRAQERAFRALSRRVRGTELRKAGLLGWLWGVITTLPELAIAAALVLGTVQVADGVLSAGTLVAFLSTALALRWPVESIGFLLAISNDSATATDRLFEVLDAPVPEDVPAGRDGEGGTRRRPGEGPDGEERARRRLPADGTDGEGGARTRPGYGPDGEEGARRTLPADGTDGQDGARTRPGDGPDGEERAPLTRPGDGPDGQDGVRRHPADGSNAGDGARRHPGVGADEDGDARTLPAAGPDADDGVGARPADGPGAGADSGAGKRPACDPDGGVGARKRTAAGSTAAARPEGDGLRLRGVGFRYADAPPHAPAVLHDVDLHVRPGETMALVGATGSGKTTLTTLIPRLQEPTEGRITLDGADVRALPRERVRALVAVAFEEATLFSATVGENVLMGAEDVAEGDLARALEVAQAGFVHDLPEGARTQVGEQGLSLSGGQRQRLALARAVVGRPRFLVLDDPLSALDVHTEALVEAALREALATTTALIVAHRPSTVLLADRVALLSGGRIAAVGTHHELLHGNAEYASLMSGHDSHDSHEGGVRR
ncbi:ABC transporter transmembrane domain-containing protein [Streptomyces sp. NPDC050610]|uniref:ABC transporter transmembrane domain-containing protein n=1 Tax=Streptomyces sp. NPDC050610 TaxID=3157097 RepID=UPI003432B6AE